MIFEIVEVKTYSGSKIDERPLSFIYRGEKIMIEEIVDRWYESGLKAGRPVYNYFKVRTGRVGFFLLRHNLAHDAWSVMLF